MIEFVRFSSVSMETDWKQTAATDLIREMTGLIKRCVLTFLVYRRETFRRSNIRLPGSLKVGYARTGGAVQTGRAALNRKTGRQKMAALA